MSDSSGLPNEAVTIAAWLGEDDVENIRGILHWHGGAAAVAAMERTRHLEPPARGPAFFQLVRAMKQTRVEAGDWPAMTHADWRRGG